MGKFVVIQRHPSNEFFYSFANTLTYESPDEFLQALATALASTPAPLTAEERHALSWEGATERFLSQVRWHMTPITLRTIPPGADTLRPALDDDRPLRPLNALSLPRSGERRCCRR